MEKGGHEEVTYVMGRTVYIESIENDGRKKKEHLDPFAVLINWHQLRVITGLYNIYAFIGNFDARVAHNP